MKPKFYICRHCGNIVMMMRESGVPLICCGEKMDLLVPNLVEASAEKHLPVVTSEGDEVHVTVGSVLHPTLPEHYIQWIYLQTEKGGQYKALKPGDTPKAAFVLKCDKAVAAYAYCNIHDLWMTEIK